MAAAQLSSAQFSEENSKAYLNDLNEEQRAAVLTVDGPVLMLAGAGTGKTRALTTRLAHLLFTGRAQPWQLLAVTFTNKAAREMKDRIEKLVGQSVEGMQWLGTFHSIGAQILRRHAELVGYGEEVSYETVLKQLHERDNRDMTRKEAPLKPAEDAHLIDTTNLSIERAFAAAVKVINAVISVKTVK